MASDHPTSPAPLFNVSNHHSANCGTPPQIDGDTKGRYYGYYANEHGEQAIFECDFETRTAQIWMGDAEWERAHPVVNGVVPSLVLNPGEMLWVGACWYAATGELPKAPKTSS